MARTLRLACLAPDIVEAIVRGEEPEGMTFRSLMKRFPVDWNEQRKSLGFVRR